MQSNVIAARCPPGRDVQRGQALMSPRPGRKAAELVTLSSKIDPDLYQRIKIAGVTQGLALQDIWDQALREWLERHPSPPSGE